jgi:hypothetical protein
MIWKDETILNLKAEKKFLQKVSSQVGSTPLSIGRIQQKCLLFDKRSTLLFKAVNSFKSFKD